MIKQEDKWLLMTTIGVPWTEMENISSEDQEFLLNKAEEIKTQMEQQQQQQQNPQLQPPNYS